MTGYGSLEYAHSLSEFGLPIELPGSGGWILRRQIDGLNLYDAMGCYPLFACKDWTQLPADLNDLGDELVSIALVTDPFGNYDQNLLQKCFPHFCTLFKQHYVINPNKDPEEFISNHHKKRAQKAFKKVVVRVHPEPLEFLDLWFDLYQTLIKRHHLRGLKAFSRETFARVLSLPGIKLFYVESDQQVVGAHLWLVEGDNAYSHLTATSPLGYKLMASFALHWFAIEYFSGVVHRLDLGAGAGLNNEKENGLSKFKEGWSTGTKPVYFCGRILNRDKYVELSQSLQTQENDYFPLYRRGEFD
jgi:hypothetical protein